MTLEEIGEKFDLTREKSKTNKKKRLSEDSNKHLEVKF